MAHASHKAGAGAQDKGDGTGAMTEVAPEDVPANMVLSNRDTAQHGTAGRAKPGRGGDVRDQRGLDSAHVQTEQMRDHPGNRLAEGEEGAR